MTIFKNTEAHLAFLASLPDEPWKKVLLKVALIGIFGFLLSLISVVAALATIKYDPKASGNWKFLMMIVAQDFPVFILTLFLFYRGRFKVIYPELWPRISNKSLLLVIGLLLLNLILGTGFNLITFIFSGSPEAVGWLENYINSGQERITPAYLYLLFQSLTVFVFISFFEEFVFRFTVFRFLRKGGLFVALMVSSILFGFIHGSNGTLGAILFGVLMALYYEYTNNLLLIIVIHAFHNLLIVYYSYFLTYYILQLRLF